MTNTLATESIIDLQLTVHINNQSRNYGGAGRAPANHRRVTAVPQSPLTDGRRSVIKTPLSAGRTVFGRAVTGPDLIPGVNEASDRDLSDGRWGWGQRRRV